MHLLDRLLMLNCLDFLLGLINGPVQSERSHTAVSVSDRRHCLVVLQTVAACVQVPTTHLVIDCF